MGLAGLNVLVVNAGSTSLKLDLVDDSDCAGSVSSIEAARGLDVAAVAHRVVHGGPRLRDPVVIDAAVREQIFELEELAPLHNAPALAGIEEAERVFPDVPQVAVFDTAFHATIPPEAAVYAVPAAWRDELGIRRYGFHGLSVQWASEQVRAPRLVVCHLGGGSSVTAVRDGRSVDTTMGFSPLEGVPMSTRSGSVDPGAIVYLLRRCGLDADTLDRMLNLESGLKGLAGGSGSMREIEARVRAGEPAAELALAVFVHRLAAGISAMAAAAGGLDALVFTGGMGEGSALVRERACARLRFLGVELDERANAAGGEGDVATPESTVRVHVVHAREELVAARAARSVLART